jgi:hypothetical protein
MSEGNGANGAVTRVEEDVQQMASAKKMSKIDIKRMQAREERRRRLINRGVPEDKVDAVMAAEDYQNLPIDKKLDRFEYIVSQALQGLQRDILALRHNDGVIAEAMDINLKAMSRALEKAGVSKEAQGDIIREVEKELREEQEKRARAEQEALRLAAEQSERERIEAELSSKPSLSSDEAPAVEIPEGATVFEG